MIRGLKVRNTQGSDRSESQIRESESFRISGSYGSKIRILRFRDSDIKDPSPVSD